LTEFLSRYRQVRARALVGGVIEPSSADVHDLLDACHLTETQHAQVLQEIKRQKRVEMDVDPLQVALDELQTLEEMYGLRKDLKTKSSLFSKNTNPNIPDATAYAAKGSKKGKWDKKGKGQSKGGKSSGKGSKGANPGKGGGSFERKPGDWTCPSCSANVFASKDKCFKCGTAKPGGGSGGKGSGGGKPQGGKKGGGKGGGKKFASGGKGGQAKGGGGGTEFKDWNCVKCKMLVFGRNRATFCPGCGEKKA
jgi:rubrerythrin